MNNFTKTISAFFVLCTTAIGGVCIAEECTEFDTEAAIAKLVEKNEGSKVLKVEETIDAQGCVELQVRILIDGTVQVITLPIAPGA